MWKKFNDSKIYTQILLIAHILIVYYWITNLEQHQHLVIVRQVSTMIHPLIYISKLSHMYMCGLYIPQNNNTLATKHIRASRREQWPYRAHVRRGAYNPMALRFSAVRSVQNRDASVVLGNRRDRHNWLSVRRILKRAFTALFAIWRERKNSTLMDKDLEDVWESVFFFYFIKLLLFW